MKEKRKIYWWIIPIVVGTMAVAGLSGQAAFSAQAPAATPPAATVSATPLQAGAVNNDILAVGTLRSSQNVSLDWSASGTVAQVLVKKGDQVQKGELLAQLDPASNVAFVTAEANLLAAQQSLGNLQNVAVAQATAKQALVNAQNAVTSDQQALDALNTPPSAAAIAGWNAFYLSDEARVTQAQTNYDYWVAYEYLPHCPVVVRTGGRGGGAGGPGAGAYNCRTLNDTDLAIQQANAKSALSAAVEKEQNDLAYLTYLQNYQPDPGLLSQAEITLEIGQEQLVIAQANEDAVKNGPDPAQIAEAQANIASIQATLDQQYLRAPFAGVVTDLAVKAGDLVSGGGYALRIDNMSALYIDLQVSEIDINHVQIGQSVELIFDGVPKKQYTATVTGMDLIGTVSGGVANFNVTAELSGADSSIKPGMTAGATIVVQK
jgi:HlyD family secretion protein